jgi:hypothetical protein
LDGSKSLLACRVPKLHLGLDLAHFISLDAEIHSNGGKVFLCEGFIGLATKQGGLTDSAIASEDHLQQHVVSHWLGYL